MHRILITGQRSFIVAKEDVIKGGKLRSYPAGKDTRHEVELSPSKSIYEVTDKCGKELSTYADVNVLEVIKEKKVAK